MKISPTHTTVNMSNASNVKDLLFLAIAALTSFALAPAAHPQQIPKQVMVHMQTTDGRDAGMATLINEKSGVEFKVDFKNLTPGQHAIHVHQNPKCDAPDFRTAGGHFNPDAKQHGYQNPQGHHAGDLPFNLTVGDDGMVKKTFLDKNITLNPSAPNSVFTDGGTSLMVHAGPDDMKSDPAGNAGSREACGIIVMDHAEQK